MSYLELKICSLYKNYSQKKVFENFNLNITEGIHALLGPNGSGKSTLMNILSLNIHRDKGEILIDNNDILDLGAKYRKLLGYMPQQQALYDDFLGIEFLTYIGHLKGLDRKYIKNQAIKILNKVDLDKFAYFKIKTYSGGMKQRLLLAATLLGDPKIIILDEPTAGLDPKQRVIVRNLIKEISSDKIILIATHILSDVEPIADTVIFMDKGKILKHHIQNGESLESLYVHFFNDEAY